jgi:hypothetical protein
MRALLCGLVLIAATAAGCTNYGYIVRREGAPLYADAQRSAVIGRLERLADGYIGHSEPEGDPVRIRYRDQKGWADRSDLRLFKYRNDDDSRYHAVFFNRREVILEGKDWPAPFKQAVRESRVENGMTKDMVELAWGYPTSTRALEAGGERWTFERRRYDVYDDVVYDYDPGGYSHFYWGFGPWGPGWGYGYAFPVYEPRYYRTYYARTERRTVTFGADGKVIGWETSTL